MIDLSGRSKVHMQTAGRITSLLIREGIDQRGEAARGKQAATRKNTSPAPASVPWAASHAPPCSTARRQGELSSQRWPVQSTSNSPGRATVCDSHEAQTNQLHR